MNRAVISVGTNSTRALVAAVNGEPRILLTLSVGTRIGEGLAQRGHLDETAMQRTLEAVREHVRAISELTGDVQVIATSALRRADNREVFAQKMHEIVGKPMQIISGEEEARRSFIGAVSLIGAPPETRFGVVDVGGGSTEYAIGTTAPQRIVSCEIGAVRVTEAVPQLAGTGGTVAQGDLERARALVREATSPVSAFARVERLAFVGGTATTAVSLRTGTRERFTYHELTRADLRALTGELCALDVEARKALPGMNPQRADILLGGLLILNQMFEWTGHERALVSRNDLLVGTLLA